MMQMWNDFLADLEFEIESSIICWSKLPPMSDDSELVVEDTCLFFWQGILAPKKNACTDANKL